MSKHHLTAKQEALCQAYVTSRNKALAYREVYGDDGARYPRELYRKAQVAFDARGMDARIDEIIQEGAAETTFTVAMAIKRWLDIATADVNELCQIRVGACRYCHGVGHDYQYTPAEYMELVANAETLRIPLPLPRGGTTYNANAEPHPDCPECHGDGITRTIFADTTRLSAAGLAIYGGVKRTKDGMQILIADRSKALENVCRVMGLFNDKVRIDADVRTMAKIVEIQTTDPEAAAKAYQEMIAAGAPT